MRSLLLFLLLLFFDSSCIDPSPSYSMINLRNIEGNWLSYKGVEFNENWRRTSENRFEGEGFSMNGVDTSFFESLSIERVGDSIYYKVNLVDESQSVDFLLIDASINSWTFMNPENDFPSIIKYSVEKDSLLIVTISDIRGNKKQHFYLQKSMQ